MRFLDTQGTSDLDVIAEVRTARALDAVDLTDDIKTLRYVQETGGVEAQDDPVFSGWIAGLVMAAYAKGTGA